MRVPVLLTASLVALSARLPAQTMGTVELGAFANYSWFDKDLHLNDKGGFGATLGLYLAPGLALEVEGLYTPTTTKSVPLNGVPLNSPVEAIPPRARLTYNIPLGGYANSIQLGAGYVRSVYQNNLDYKDNGITGLAGFRIGLTQHFALRAAGTLDYVPSPQAPQISNYMNWGVQAGFSILMGNKYDKDHDKIADKRDRCPQTPKGVPVDTAGCSAEQRDTDHDGLADATDKCPDTPAGAKVDPEGCADTQRDSDRDNVADANDKCPSTPAGEKADENGCSLAQLDKDHDGVMDLADRCPNTEPGPAVDEHGCSAAQRDSDGDGVMDIADRCPNTIAGTTVDASGCPNDTDKDGVPDAVDKCPNTAAGNEVDENGCTRLFKATGRTMVLMGAQFETGKAELTEDSKTALKDVADALISQPETKVEVAGYTDNTGSKRLNTKLSQARANAVKEFLVQSGVPETQLTAKGYGPDKPVADNKTAEGRAKNRRVELIRK